MMRGRLIGRFIIFLLAVFEPVAGRAQPVIFSTPLSPRIANYDIDARLDPQDRAVHGHETLTWTNQGGQAAGELQFHLYPNAFRNNKSSFMRESWDKAGKALKREGWGYMEIAGSALGSGEDLTAAREFIHPDDDNADDKTVIRLPLPRPV